MSFGGGWERKKRDGNNGTPKKGERDSDVNDLQKLDHSTTNCQFYFMQQSNTQRDRMQERRIIMQGQRKGERYGWRRLFSSLASLCGEVGLGSSAE